MTASLNALGSVLRLPVAILAWLIASAAVGLLSHWVASRFSIGSRRQVILQWIFWWYFLVTSTVWAAGIVGLLRPVWILGVLALIVGVLLDKDRRLAPGAWGDVVWVTRTMISGFRKRPVAGGLLLVLGSIVCVRQLVHVWILPPLIYDVVSYHLPKIADWVREGRLVALPTAVVRSYWPANFELFQTWFVLFWRQDAIIESAGLVCCALATVSVYCIARSLGISRTVGVIAAAAYATAPAVLLNAAGGNNDIAIAGCFLFIVAVVLEWRNRRPAFSRVACLVCCAAGIGLGTKAYLAFMMPALVLLWPVFRSTVPNGLPGDGKTSGWVMSGLFLAGLTLALYWYVRNLCLFSNPVYPADLRLFGKLLAGDGHGSMWQQGGFSLKSLGATVSDIVTRRIFDNAGPYTPDLNYMTGWGWFAVCVGLPAAAIQCFRNRRFFWVLSMFLLAMALVLAFVASDPWNMRFLLWFPAVFALGWAFLIEDVRDATVRRAALCLATLCLAMNVLSTLNNGLASPEDWRYYRHASVKARVSRSSFDGIGRAVPAGATVAYFMGPMDPVYVLYGSEMNRRLFWLRIEKPGDSFYQAMCKAGLTYLAIDANQVVDREWYDPFRQELKRGLFRHLGSQCYEVVR